MIIAGFITYLGYSMFIDVNRSLKDVHATTVVMTLYDVKAGHDIQMKSIVTTDKQEIEEIMTTLEKPTLYKTLPDLGNVPSNEHDRLELSIGFDTGTDFLLEYFVTSQGEMKFRRDNGKYSSNLRIFMGSTKTWFEQLKRLYDSKEQNEKWS